MKKEISIALKTMAIKARVFNQIRQDIYKKTLEETNSSRYNKEVVLTDEEKVNLFNKWFSLGKEAHTELYFYKNKRQRKAEIQRLRDERKEKVS